MSSAVERFLAGATTLGFEAQVTRYPEGTRTARDAAAAVGCELGQIVKSLVFVAGGRPVMALVSGADRVDTARLAMAAGAAAARQAKADEVQRATGFAIGGVPPFAHTPQPDATAQPGNTGAENTPVTFMDRGLLAFDTVWAAAGAPDACFPITPADLARLSGATIADIAEQSAVGGRTGS